ncbi:hypothetical protein [Massilia sp. X63]|uniref:hypothetical protein n=1 Tax=Massilia sp. X63 TaxID=3237285 RepID=UPI0034DD72CE
MDQIFSREAMQQRGADAFNAGRPRDSHGMNPFAAALPDWLAGYDRAAQEECVFFRRQAEIVTKEAA